MFRFAMPGLVVVAGILDLMAVSLAPPLLPGTHDNAPALPQGSKPSDGIRNPRHAAARPAMMSETRQPGQTESPAVISVVPSPAATMRDAGVLPSPRAEPQASATPEPASPALPAAPQREAAPAKSWVASAPLQQAAPVTVVQRPLALSLHRPGSQVALMMPRERVEPAQLGNRLRPPPGSATPNATTLRPKPGSLSQSGRPLFEPAPAWDEPTPSFASMRLFDARSAVVVNNLDQARLQLELAQTHVVFQPIRSERRAAAQSGTHMTSEITQALSSLSTGDRPGAVLHIDLAIADAGSSGT
ncbi:MAG: hypothetical protein M3Y41_15445 [Pseudomonadota bacterium]|nr:hypothetical protein [Pseudomonadota bacterium]